MSRRLQGHGPQAQADAQRQVVADRATLDRTVRQLIALAHPDPTAGRTRRWRTS